MKRYLIPSDYSAAESWRLVEWCRSIGATEFTIDFLSSAPGHAGDGWDEFDELVRPLALGDSIRERMSGATADDLRRATECWSLDDTSIDALKNALPEGIFQYEPRPEGHFEDPIFYRDGELLFGVLSHEAFGILRLTESESERLAAARFPSHDALPRFG